MKNLRAEIATNITRHDAARFDMMNIIETCEHYFGSLEELLDIVQFYENDSKPMQNLVNLRSLIYVVI